MGRVSREARLCFIMLWTLADDEGRLRGNSRMLASLLFPYDDDAKDLIEVWLHELDKEQCIIIYSIGSDHYIEICNWLKHQKIDHPSKSKIPDSREGSRIVAPDLRIKDQGEDLKPSARKARGSQNLSQVAKAECSPRHHRTQELIMGWYSDWAETECPWDGAEAKQLSSLLKAWPRSTDDQFVTCLENIAASDCIPKGDRPREWLGKLPKFLHGPLDQFWKAKANGNGNRRAFLSEGVQRGWTE
jgi:hypothetical protein